MKEPIVYIITNRRNGAVYTGVSSNLVQRIYQHKMGQIPGFSQRYKCKMLVYYELCGTMDLAITREKQLKAGSRKKKLNLIETMNPEWHDLYDFICGKSWPYERSNNKIA